MRVNTRETAVALPGKPTIVEHHGKAHMRNRDRPYVGKLKGD